MASTKGTLFLIPITLTEAAPGPIAPHTLRALGTIQHFIVERARTARRYIKGCHTSRDISVLNFYELDKRTPETGIRNSLKAALAGSDIGLMSEAGCPGVADPGALVVAMAHELGIKVVPLVGPSSILLGLMASGMNGQSFRFNGYLPAKKPALNKALKSLEQYSSKNKQTEVWIEAPYRNMQMIEEALSTLSGNTKFCVALNLTAEDELIISKKVKDWPKPESEVFHKKPAIFLMEA